MFLWPNDILIVVFTLFMVVFVCILPADEEGQHHPELSAEGPGGPQKGLQWAQVRFCGAKECSQNTLSFMNERVHSWEVFVRAVITIRHLAPAMYSLQLWRKVWGRREKWSSNRQRKWENDCNGRTICYTVLDDINLNSLFLMTV